MVARMVGSAETAFDGSLESVGQFCFGDVLRHRKNVFTCISFKKNYKYTLNTTYKDNDSINCITPQHNTGTLPSNLTGHKKQGAYPVSRQCGSGHGCHHH